MEGYVALYRAWRPSSFAEVVGQEHVSRTLRNAVAGGKVGHAYMFCGPRGTGKTSLAKILARAVNCLQPQAGEPCGACIACENISAGKALDVVEIDAASHRGIDEIRDLREKARYAPVDFRFKVYIVDEVHMLTQEAFNALLKTLEEPPSHTLFILATTDPQRVPPTVISRCQRFDFHRLTGGEIAARLKEVCQSKGVTAGEDVLLEIARHADGGLRDALGLLDQCLAFAGDEITCEDLRLLLGIAGDDLILGVARALLAGDAVSVLKSVERLNREGRDFRQFARDLTAAFRDLLLVRVAPNAEELIEGGGGRRQALCSLAGMAPAARLMSILPALSSIEGDLRWAGQPRLLLEMGLLGIILEDRAAGEVAGMAAEKATERAAEKVTDEVAVSVDPVDRNDQIPFAPAHLQAHWRTVMEKIKRRQRPLHALLEQARPTGVKEGKLVLGFDPKWAIHRDRVAHPDNRLLLEKVIKETFGDIAVECVVEPAGAASREDFLGLAFNEFGGEVVELQLEINEDK